MTASNWGPGSPKPSTPEAVELLLRRVPELAFAPEFDALLPATGSWPPLAVEVAADDGHRAGVAEALAAIVRRAQAADDGGLLFLATTLLHFMTDQRIEPTEHPLFVALHVRGAARKAGKADTPGTVARVLDQM